MKQSSPKLRFAGKAKELMCLNSYINILDNKKVIIENCKQIIECNEVMARIMTGSFQVEIWGKDLSLSNYCSESIEVCGTIESVALTSRRIKERE